MAQKEYNRNASTLERKSPIPTYAESLLYQKGFRFQSRHHEDKIDLRRISKVDVDKIIKDVDLEELQSLLENITFAEITEEDFDLYSNDCFVKLFQINQLTLEYLLDVQDTLSANLNGLARKYAVKKREVENLSKNLARQDAEVATLRDELHHTKELMKKMESPTAVAGLNPCLFPSQEMRREVETSSEKNVVSNDFSKSSCSDEFQDVAQFNVDSSIHEIHLAHDIYEKLQNDSINSESGSITFKGKHLVEPLQTINEGIKAHNNVLALEISPQYVEPVNKETQPYIESAEIQKSEGNNDIVNLKLEDLVRVATLAHKELVEASQTLQHHASSQDKNSECLIEFIGSRLHNLESILIEEVQRSVREAMLEHSCTQANVQNNATLSADILWTEEKMITPAQLNKFNIGDDEIVDGDVEVNKDRQVMESNGDTVSTTRPVDDAEQKRNTNKTDLFSNRNGEYQWSPCVHPNDSKHTHSFGPLTELDCRQENISISDIKGETEDDASGKVSFQLPHAYNHKKASNNSVIDDISIVVYSPSQEKSPKSVNHETGNTKSHPILPTTLVSLPTPRSQETIDLNIEHARSCDYESADCISYDTANETHNIDNNLSEISGYAPVVHVASVAGDSDMQSIEVSQSEFRAIVDPPSKADMSKDTGTINYGERKRLNKTRRFFNMIARGWVKKESRTNKRLPGKIGKLYDV